jgi:translation initiation factor 2 beta subunit (eIF-2beta)/eIF-5
MYLALLLYRKITSPSLKRKPEHVLNYVLAELGTNGSVDGKHRLVIKGRFQPKQIENVVRHYICMPLAVCQRA